MNYSVHSFTLHHFNHTLWETERMIHRAKFPAFPNTIQIVILISRSALWQITSSSVAVINRLQWLIGGMSRKGQSHTHVMSAIPTERSPVECAFSGQLYPCCICECVFVRVDRSRQLGAACHSYVRGQYEGQDRYWWTMVICLVAPRQRTHKKELSKLFKQTPRSDKPLFLSMDKVENNEMLPSFSNWNWITYSTYTCTSSSSILYNCRTFMSISYKRINKTAIMQAALLTQLSLAQKPGSSCIVTSTCTVQGPE